MKRAKQFPFMLATKTAIQAGRTNDGILVMQWPMTVNK